MKLKYLISSACVAALAFGPLSAFGASKSSASPSPKESASPSAKPRGTPAAKAERAIPFKGTATAVDQSAKTFTIAGKETSRVFKVTDKSTVTKAGAASSMAELMENDAVTGSYWKQEDGTLEVKSLKIGGKTEGEKPSKKSKKADATADLGSTAVPSPSPKK